MRRLVEIPAIIGGDQVCQFLAVFQQVELNFWRGHTGKSIIGRLGNLAAQDMARIHHGRLTIRLRNIAEHARRLQVRLVVIKGQDLEGGGIRQRNGV